MVKYKYVIDYLLQVSVEKYYVVLIVGTTTFTNALKVVEGEPSNQLIMPFSLDLLS